MKKIFSVVLVLLVVLLGATACLNNDVKEVISEKTYEGFTVAEIKLQNKNLKLDEKILNLINEKYPNVIDDDHLYVVCGGEKMFWPEERLFAMLDGTCTLRSEDEIEVLLGGPFSVSDGIFNNQNVVIKILSPTEQALICLADVVTCNIPGTTALLELAINQDLEAALASLPMDLLFFGAGKVISKIKYIDEITKIGTNFKTAADISVKTIGFVNTAVPHTNAIIVNGIKDMGEESFVLEILADAHNTPGNDDKTLSYGTKGLKEIEFGADNKIHNGQVPSPYFSDVTASNVRHWAEELLADLKDEQRTDKITGTGLFYYFYDLSH